MTITRTIGAQKSFDEKLVDLYLFDMTDHELRQLAITLHFPYEAIQLRAATARHNRAMQACEQWQVP